MARNAQGRLTEHFPIVVVGAGPTGLTLANLLGVYGAKVLLVERNPATVHEPRAVSIDDESLRTMQAAGVVDLVLNSVVPGYGSEYRGPNGRCFLKVSPTDQPYGYPRRNAFRQPILEGQLLKALDRFPLVEARFGWTLDDYKQDDELVTLTLLSADGPVRVTCDYLVGADGAASTVRTKLGLALEGETFSEKWLIVDLEQSPTASRETQVFCDARRPCIALPGPNLTRRFEFKLLPGEEPEAMADPSMVEQLLRDHGAHPDSVVRRIAPYTFHARLAPRWSEGRVFLVGDACHLTPPFAGQGMNSGIRDAHNLAWKLAWTASGRAPRTLLRTYEEERRDHVAAMIQLALRMGRIMAPKTRLQGLLTRAAFTALGAWPAARDYFAEMKYKPPPRFETGFVIASDQALGRSLVGRLLPQPQVTDGSGRRRLLDHHLGDGFALLGIDVADDLLETMAALPGFKQLNPKLVHLRASLQNTRTTGVALAAPKADWINAHKGRVLLIRPDHYVAGAFPAAGAAAISAALQAMLAPDSPVQTARHHLSHGRPAPILDEDRQPLGNLRISLQQAFAPASMTGRFGAALANPTTGLAQA